MLLARWKSPSDNTGEILDYHYGHLRSAKTGIRLAQILPGTGNKGVAINLVDSFITGSNQIEYDALSYTWGDGERSKSISCNGKRLAVTPTLLEALHRFRHQHHVVTLWIDQICICQDRIKERNAQVALMGKIFQGARKVIVWLGEDYEDSKAGMQLAKQLLGIARYQPVSGLTPADLETHGLPRRGHKRWLALSSILRRPWFWRTWIVQEVVLNPSVELVLGPASMSWDELESVVSLLEGPMPKVWQLDQAISAAELPFSRINRIRLRHQRLINTPISPLQGDINFTNFTQEPDSLFPINMQEDDNDDPELLDLLLMSRGLGASDPRDKIYALLGLGKHDIDPDYSMTPESVFVDFALQTIGVVTELAHLRRDLSSHLREVRRALILVSCAGRHNQKLSLPSWVPDWTVPLSSRPLVFGLGGRRFSAGGTRLGVFDWHPDFGLQLCGKLLDTVDVVGSVLLDWDTSPTASSTNSSTTSPHDLIHHWNTEATCIAQTRIARSPGSTRNNPDASFAALRRDLALCPHGYYLGHAPIVPKGAPKHQRRPSLLEALDEDSIEDSALHMASQTLTLGPTRGRVLFTTTNGHVGLAPHGTREGDCVVVVLGADVPFVLRPLLLPGEGKGKGEEDGYELVGEAYVQGVMDGEAMGWEGVVVRDLMVR